MTKTELLSPAGDLACGKAALDAGADAVYIGASRFGAREKAANPTEDIAALCDYARLFGARVYATVNTILFDGELEDCRRLICALYEAGADGIIIQDTAILEMDLPPVKLIASTQMNCGSPEKICFFYNEGIRRFILPRELSLEEIRHIRKNIPSDAELEAFIHGALCVARSGECYLSWHIGRRSGNRGCCAQPCRNVYALKDEGGRLLAKGHLLSLRDLSLSEHLAELADCGVSSFKIEGRLKGADYVTNVTAFYRGALDRVIAEKGLERSSAGAQIPDRPFEPDINKTFNRGYTAFMINGRKKGVSSMDTPSMKGEYLGRVKKVRGKRVFLDTAADARGGDGIAFFAGGTLTGTNVNLQESPDSITVNDPRGIKPDTVLFRNRDAAWYKTVPVFKRYVPVTVSAQQTEKGLLFGIRDEDGCGFSLTVTEAFERAKDRENAESNLKKQLSKKSPGSVFLCKEVTLDVADVPFVPLGRLNAVRRALHEGLEKARREKKPAFSAPSRRPGTYIADTLDYKANISNRLAARFYEKRGVREYEKSPETGTRLSGRQVMECAYCLRRELGLCSADKEKNTPLILENDTVSLRAEFCCPSCVMRLIALK